MRRFIFDLYLSHVNIHQMGLALKDMTFVTNQHIILCYGLITNKESGSNGA